MTPPNRTSTGPPSRPADRRSPLLIVSLAICVGTLVGCSSEETAAPDHIFLVTIDTLRADHTEFLGYPAQTTPFLSKLAEESVVFTNAYSSAAHTTPAHASLFTALYPDQHGARENGQPFGRKVDTIASVLQGRGYRTAAFSSVGFLEGLQFGFDHFDAFQRGASIYRPADDTLDRAQRWISEQKDRKPLFVWVHLFDVHEWSTVRQEDRIRLKDIEVASELSIGQMQEFLREEHGMSTGSGSTEEQRVRGIDSYNKRIVLVDNELQRFFRTFQESKKSGDSLWIITADHGEGLFSHNYKGHGLRLFREQLHVPLLLHSTRGFGSGVRIESLARHVDILPTIAELAAAPLGKTQGRSLVPLITGDEQPDRDRTAYAQRKPVVSQKEGSEPTPEEMRTVYDLRYKYIFDSRAGEEFYDLTADPLELENLIENPPPAELKRFKDELDAYRRVFDRRRVRGAKVSEETKAELRDLGYVE